MSQRYPLAVWLYGTRLAELSEDRSGAIGLNWTAAAYDRWGDGARIMSNLLPLSRPDEPPHPRRVRVFIDNLLPEGNARVNYAMDVGVRPEDTFGLIERYGRDTAGALVFQTLDEPEPDRVGEYLPLTSDEVGHRLQEADRHSPTDPTVRGVESISLAGMQPKIGLHRIDGVWQACRSGAPSTWIVKLAHPVDSIAQDVVDTEVLSLDLARAIDLTTVDAALHDFAGVRAIAVRRYDRIEAQGRIDRIHQEDLAQALGINTADPNRKFQRGNQLPSLSAAADVLRAGGSEPFELLRLVCFNYLIGNTDAHAKNYSFIRDSDGTARLAPAYDVAMHLHHARPRPLSAMDINGKSYLNEITIGDVVAEGVSWRIPERLARELVADTIVGLEAAIEAVDLGSYPGVPIAAVDLVKTRIALARSATDSTARTGRTPAARRGPRRRSN